jgi:hypothetical protein
MTLNIILYVVYIDIHLRVCELNLGQVNIQIMYFINFLLYFGQYNLLPYRNENFLVVFYHTNQDNKKTDHSNRVPAWEG